MTRGDQAQDEAKSVLEMDGWLVEMAKPSVRVRWDRELNDYRREQRHDFFRVADLIAVKPRRVRLIQVTHPSGLRERFAKIRELVPTELLLSDVLSWEVWVKENGGFTEWPVTSKNPTPIGII